MSIKDTVCCSSTEEGVSVLARAAPRPSLARLCPLLFAPKGIAAGDVVQVTGEAGCGKSALLLHFLSRALLPRTWCNVPLGGCGAGALVVDTDLRFSVLQLSVMMEMVVKRKVNTAKQNLAKKVTQEQRKLSCGGSSSDAGDVVSREVLHPRDCVKAEKCKPKNTLQYLMSLTKKNLKVTIKEFIKSLLRNLVYLKCYQSTQFANTLISIDQVLAANPLVSLICVDSLSSFYWYDRTYTTDSWQKNEQYYNKIFQAFIQHVRTNGIVLVCVKQMLYSRHKTGFGRQFDDGEDDEYNFLGQVFHTAVSYAVNITRPASVEVQTPLQQQQKEQQQQQLKPPRPVYCVDVKFEATTRRLGATFHEDGVRWSPARVDTTAT